MNQPLWNAAVLQVKVKLLCTRMRIYSAFDGVALLQHLQQLGLRVRLGLRLRLRGYRGLWQTVQGSGLPLPLVY